MRIQFLGTAASPSTPMPFCNCGVCKQAREIGGKNSRKRSSAIIDKNIIIDIGPDLMSAAAKYSVSISEVKVCLQTHFHEDHFDPEIIISRHDDYGNIDMEKLLIVSSKPTLMMMDEIISRRCGYGSIFDENVQQSLHIELKIIEKYKSYNIGKYKVTPYPANHGLPEHECYIYKIEDGNCCIFYGTDTSVIFEEVWEHLVDTNTKFDLVILDCTYGIGYKSVDGDHLASNEFIEQVKLFEHYGLLNLGTDIFATHISHEGIMEHTKYEAYAISNGYRIAYDGLCINI